VADLDDYFDYERPLDFVSRAERRKLMKEAAGDEEKANQILISRANAAAGVTSEPEKADSKKPKEADVVDVEAEESAPSAEAVEAEDSAPSAEAVDADASEEVEDKPEPPKPKKSSEPPKPPKKSSSDDDDDLAALGLDDF
jgi:hypothetical protein